MDQLADLTDVGRCQIKIVLILNILMDTDMIFIYFEYLNKSGNGAG